MIVNSNIRYEPLPSKLFKVRVPMIATYTPEEIKLLGMNVNVVNGVADMGSIYTPTLVHLPLDRIIDIYMEGYRPITLVDRQELEEVYNILDSYVRGLASTNNFVINMPGIVEERLYDIERFAAEIFKNNKIAILRQALKFEHGYDAKVNTVNMAQVAVQHTPEQPEYGYGYENHMSGYSTVLSSSGINQSTRYNNYGNDQQVAVGNTVADSFRVNPNKPQVDGYTYINKNLPEMDYDSIVRNKTIIKINQ